jgi:cell division GTPase FtsZ
MRTGDVLKKIPGLKRHEMYLWGKRGFIHSQVVVDGRVRRHEWDPEEVKKIQLIKQLCNSGLPPKEVFDHRDIRTIMHQKGPLLVSTGSGTGTNRAIDACHVAVSNLLIDTSALKPTKVLFNLIGPSDLLFSESEEAVNVIMDGVGTTTDLIFGITIDSKLNDEVKALLFATGLKA